MSCRFLFLMLSACVGGLAAFGLGVLTPQATAGPSETRKYEVNGEYEVEYHVLGRLGRDHFTSAAYRRGLDGSEQIVAWGDYVVEWTLKPEKPERVGSMRIVVPERNNFKYTDGGCALDVDGDGVDEIVVARGQGRNKSDPELIWLEEMPDREDFQAHEIDPLDEAGNWQAPHDIEALEVETPDGRVRGVVYNIARRHLYFAAIPEDPTEQWPVHEIGTFPTGNQSGITIADVDDNGRDDILSGLYWIETPSDPREGDWAFHRFSTWEHTRWSGMVKHEMADFDGDGSAEIVIAEAEIPDARVSIFKQGNDPRRPWSEVPVAEAVYAPHSMHVGDVDGDGRADLILGEMEAGGWDFPLQENPRIYAYLNRGDLEFERTVLFEGEGTHEMAKAPIRIDGKVVLFGADDIQARFEEVETHIGLWLVGPTD